MRFAGRFFAVAIVGSALLGSVPRAAATDLPVVRVGVVYDGEWALVRSLIEGPVGVRAELDLLVEGEFKVEYPEDAQLDGGWDLAQIDRAFRQLLADDRIDVVIAAGLAASQIACLGRDGYDKPVIAPLSLDFEIQNLPREGTASGVRNLTYVGMPSTLRHELQTFQELVRFDHVALIANKEVLEAMPEIRARTLDHLQGAGVEATYVPADRTADDVLSSVPADADVVYIWPLLLDHGEMARLIEGLNARRLPSFSWLGKDQVEAGMYATLSPDAGRARLARRVALTIQQILLGAAPETLDVDFPTTERLIINVDTARRIGAWPRFEVLLEAETIGDLYGGDLPQLTLFDAVYRAVDANRDLAVQRAAVEAGLQDLKSALARYRPTLDAAVTATQIDEDRAAASGGLAVERSATGTLSASQLIFSDEAGAAITVERRLREAREASLERTYLDVALDTAVAYFGVLRAETQVEVLRANLAVTRSNLELARSRAEVGTASRAEIHRWEAQIANDRRSLVQADATQLRSRVALNRLLHEPTDVTFDLTDVSTDDPSLPPANGLLDGYIETPLHFQTLTEFAVGEAIEIAPEIRELDASIAAQERVLLAARRKSWAPVIGAQARLDETLDTSGAGSGPLPPGAPDDTDWSIGVSATLPIYSGGDRRAGRRRAELDLAELRLRREAAVEGIETSMRTALIAARASFTAIRLAEDAADAARRNLELVRDAYARGAISIIDLIDAQNSSLQSDLVASDASYNFFIDLMSVQRAANRFDFFTTPEERQAWARRLAAHFESRGVKPWGTP